MYMQMVDRLDQGAISSELGPFDYKGLFKAVSKALFRAHVEGQLKSEIMAEPEWFVKPDTELPFALLNQKETFHRSLSQQESLNFFQVLHPLYEVVQMMD
ncbi:uncharacterized protein LOC109844275 isoform X3 [Asparagus officinalis]|uniref:uncharacterized protein LOC109844275 isoform X3 n=1 Tax=Asparagus officinalis TaxID=4686 RepID=UPI00098E6CC8|nr:uncharacterized protein LOC109844275 isoform X3 [Asparagus officinalis]XP_020268837.1 uncharacterized protein LOC109844275 isoform X3 [Asparagus officinalis]